MSRFEFEEFKRILGIVVAGKDQPYQVEFEVPMPIGQFYGDVALELLEIVNEFGSKMDDPESMADATLAAFDTLRTNKKFWSRLLPSALGLRDVFGKPTKDDKKATAYFREFLTNVELVQLFMEAAAMIVNHSFGSDEAEEALAKSEGGEVAEEGGSQASDGLTLPQ